MQQVKIKDKKIVKNLDKDKVTWDTAISDAEKMILDEKTKIRRLRDSIRAFEWLRDKGVPFPGERAQST